MSFRRLSGFVFTRFCTTDDLSACFVMRFAASCSAFGVVDGFWNEFVAETIPAYRAVAMSLSIFMFSNVDMSSCVVSAIEECVISTTFTVPKCSFPGRWSMFTIGVL